MNIYIHSSQFAFDFRPENFFNLTLILFYLPQQTVSSVWARQRAVKNLKKQNK